MNEVEKKKTVDWKIKKRKRQGKKGSWQEEGYISRGFAIKCF